MTAPGKAPAKALVTGGTGFIGGWIARALVEAGWEVRCLARPSSPRAHLGDLSLEFAEGDLRDPASLRRAAEGCQALFHAAGYYALWSAEPETFQRSNVEGTRSVLEAARGAGVGRVVYVSSVACLGEAPPGGLADEDTPATPEDLCGDYKRSKFQAEQIALAAAAAGQEVVIVNPSSVIGPGDLRPTPTGQIIVDFLRGRMPAYLDTGLNFVDVRDVAQGARLAYERGVPGRRYIIGNARGNKSLREFLSLVGEVAGRRAPRLKAPYALAYLAGAASTALAELTGRPPAVPLVGVQMARHRMFFDPGRAIRELGLPQTPLRETVADAVGWFRARGMVPPA
ncbi:MAG: hopanoid-associated sugar epimerase [Planctomycetota bacterium]